MKRNVNVFIAVILVAVLSGGIVWMQSADDEKLGWNIHDSYGEAPAYSGGAAYTNATFAGPSAGEGGVMTLSPSRSLGRGVSSSYAGAYSGAATQPLASSPLTSSPLSSAPSGAGLYTTSSQTFNSYGGGGNGGAAMGGPMRGSSSPNSLIASSPITSISSPIAYSTARRSDMTVAAGDNPAQMAAENPVMAMTNAASAGVGNGFYGFGSVVDYSGAASYGEYNAMFGGRSNVRGRQNAPTAGTGNTWQTWLLDVWLPSQNGVWGTQGEDGNWYITEDQLRAAYDAFMAGWNNSYDGPTFADWLAWFDPYGSGEGLGIGGNTYYWLPVGDILPLLLIALLYVLFVAIKSNALKSLIKTERSE